MCCKRLPVVFQIRLLSWYIYIYICVYIYIYFMVCVCPRAQGAEISALAQHVKGLFVILEVVLEVEQYRCRHSDIFRSDLCAVRLGMQCVLVLSGTRVSIDVRSW